jgi:hypothetical protein
MDACSDEILLHPVKGYEIFIDVVIEAFKLANSVRSNTQITLMSVYSSGSYPSRIGKVKSLLENLFNMWPIISYVMQLHDVNWIKQLIAWLANSTISPSMNESLSIALLSKTLICPKDIIFNELIYVSNWISKEFNLPVTNTIKTSLRNFQNEVYPNPKDNLIEWKNRKTDYVEWLQEIECVEVDKEISNKYVEKIVEKLTLNHEELVLVPKFKQKKQAYKKSSLIQNLKFINHQSLIDIARNYEDNNSIKFAVEVILKILSTKAMDKWSNQNCYKNWILTTYKDFMNYKYEEINKNNLKINNQEFKWITNNTKKKRNYLEMLENQPKERYADIKDIKVENDCWIKNKELLIDANMKLVQPKNQNNPKFNVPKPKLK